MTQSTHPDQPDDNLRHEAKQSLTRNAPATLPQATESDTRALVHELQVHQIELEMQNDELQRAQREVIALEAKYRELYDFAPIGYVTLDAGGHILEANLAGAALLGIGRRELINRRFTSLLSLDSYSAYRVFSQHLQETGIRQTCEISLPKSDGALRYLQAVGIATDDIEEANRQIRLAILDITERKRFEELSEESAQLFRNNYDNIFGQGPLGIVFADLHFRFLHANKQFCEILGYTMSELLLMHLQDITHPDDSSIAMENALQQLGGVHINHAQELRYLRKDGEVRWARVLITLMRDSQNRPIHFLKMIEDITEQKLAELALQKSEAQLAGIIGSAMDAIISIDEAQQIILFNPAAEKMFRCSATEALGQSIDRFIPIRFRAIHSEYIHTFGQTGITGRSMASLTPIFGLRADGEEFPIEATISHTETPDVHFYSVIIRDITERKRLEQTAQRQTNALIQTLKALKTLPEMDVFLEQLLATMTQCLDGASASLWLYDQERDTLSIYMTYEDGGSITRTHSDHPATLNPLNAQGNPFWVDLLRTRQPIIIDHIDEEVPDPYREWFLTRCITKVLLVPLLLGDIVIGWISIRSVESAPYRQGELELAQALAQQATLALQMSRLAEQGRQTAILQERNRIAQDIHDTLAQGFTGILIQLEAAAYAPEQEKAQMHFAYARDLARHSLQEARRSVRALRPQALEGENLSGAFAHLTAHLTSAISIRVDYQVHGKPYALSEEVEGHLYRIGQEALTNAVKHSKAAEIHIDLSFEQEQVHLSIRDDGKGFDTQAGLERHGLGLIGMYERAEKIGAQMTLTAPPGCGTTITVTLPVTSTQTEGVDNG